MPKEKKKNTVAVCEELAAPIAAQMGLDLWDVRFEKEGSGWYLRYFLDKEGGVDINDCETFSRTIDKILDELDPIECGYCLEVSSPGVERELCRPAHFQQCLGHQVTVRLIRPLDGVRDFQGALVAFDDDTVTIQQDDPQPLTIIRGDTAYVRLYDDYCYGGEDQ